ncbi:MAG: hypothetical protein EOS63_05485 [Mesorhizobium sp.]|uniref:hypothetical protein n=1 Tax=Mesorhizobium sp. TaxID=1871066 RepID=UPI000FE5C24D|nr:hypothetical protein [Mesorhizobium sp.]RWE83141.1 MAG: hypothetical protein EOS63_05485 [Mesorhizobium sp.]TJW60699.1 MAG: hypothetical protein E5V97_23235 [Mesorhizobium sp.]
MTDTLGRPENARAYIIQRLMEETGISVEEAKELIGVLGFEWPSLLREAHIIAERKQAGRA